MDQRIKEDKLIFLVEKKEKKDEFVKTESNLRSILSCILIDGSNYRKNWRGLSWIMQIRLVQGGQIETT